MKLEEIGFYTLSDERTKNVSAVSPLMRAELIITDKCNFSCPYCRGLKKNQQGTMSFDEVKMIIDLWAKDNLKNIRFSGGEPTIHPNIVEIIAYAKSKNIEKIAVSTNGSANFSLYEKMVNAGANDFSISLDACCASFGDKMAGGVKGAWERVVENIKRLSAITYVTVGVVVTEETMPELEKVIYYADSLGVSDIRIISAAQFNGLLENVKNLDDKFLAKYPILKYRIENIRNGVGVRGMNESDYNRCAIALDDMAVAGVGENMSHYPCIIHLREGGDPIGKVGPNMRKEREEWFKNHDTFKDIRCKNNCLDCIVLANNRYRDFHKDCP